MPETVGFPSWVSEQISALSEDALALNSSVDAINASTDAQERRAIYVGLVRSYCELADSLRRFRFVLRINGLDDFKQKLVEGGKNLDLNFDELAACVPGTRNVLFVDTETTGLGERDEPTIAAVLASVQCGTGVIPREFHSYYGKREPSWPISDGAYRIHGLADKDLAGSRFDLKELVTLFGVSDLVVAHNASFDERMLRVAGLESNNWQCSLRSVSWPASAEGRSLDALCEYFSVFRAQPHNAMSDVRALMAVLSKRASNGKAYLAQLLGDGRSALSIE